MKRRHFLKYALNCAVFVLILVTLKCGTPKQIPVSVLKDGQRILFIGDSITYAGTFIDYIETYLLAKYPGKKFEIVDLGLGSETVCGLTEPGHPYARPNVHERLQRVLERTRPDLVVACYGMNDGIYSPFSQDRFKAYQDGIYKLIERVKEFGAYLYLLTPPPFDPVSVKDKVVDENADIFGFSAPYINYDNVLKRYGDWIMSLEFPNVEKIDVHKSMINFLLENRKTNPDYYLSRDGVHPGPVGHWLMAQTILEAWGEEPVIEMCEINAKKQTVRQGDVENIVKSNGKINFSWKARVSVQLYANETQQKIKLNNKLIGHKLFVKNTEKLKFELYEGEKSITTLSQKELKDGIDLSQYLGLSINKRGVKLLNMVRQKRRIYDYSLLNDIGHSRPMTTSPMPLNKAEERAKELELRIKETAYPVAVQLRLIPVNDK